MSALNKSSLPLILRAANTWAKTTSCALKTFTEISDVHIKLINSSWDYHPDPKHSIETISESKVQAFADAISVKAISDKTACGKADGMDREVVEQRLESLRRIETKCEASPEGQSAS